MLPLAARLSAGARAAVAELAGSAGVAADSVAPLASEAERRRAIESAVEIQRRIADAEGTGRMPGRIRIGMAAGEPVTERNDLFGATVQLAARLCSRADPGGILVASAVHDLALGKGFAFRSRGRLRLKGFDSPMSAFEVVWRTNGS